MTSCKVPCGRGERCPAPQTRTVSLFDILGPVMTGPSSSHTAGVLRIGRMGRMLLGGTPEKIDIFFYGALAETFRGHMSDAATVGGLLGLDEDSPEVGRALEIAENRGIRVTFHPERNSSRNPNTVDMLLAKGDNELRVVGISVGGGEILVEELDGFEVSLRGGEDAVLFEMADETTPYDEALRQLGGLVKSIETSSHNGKRLIQFIAERPLSDAETNAIRESSGVTRVYPLASLLPHKLVDSSPLFSSVAELLEGAEGEKAPLHELAIRYEMKRSGFTREEILGGIGKIWTTMRASTERGLRGDNELIAGFMPGDDARRLSGAVGSHRTIGDETLTMAVARAIASMEVNASMGCVAAAPTAGACGVIPGTLITVAEKRGIPNEKIVEGLLVAALVGTLIAMRAPISGALGGCQSEIGVGSAMAAAALVHIGGGSPGEVAESVAMSLKNILGLVCDPVAGPVEVPCIKRNSIGVANALAVADMALAGIRSLIPADEVIDALADVQRLLPRELRGTMLGGLGATPTGKRFKEIWMDKLKKPL